MNTMNKRKKVVLLGDSIRLLGYGKRAAELLEGDGCEVFQPEENCRYAKYTQRLLFERWESIRDADVIHFNCGLWDVYDQFRDGETFSTVTEYCDTVERIARRLLAVTPHVIFSTTTPVRVAHAHVRTADVERFNAAVVPRLRALGVTVHDLFRPVSEHLERYILPTDNIHLTEEGAEACAALVAAAVRHELARTPT